MKISMLEYSKMILEKVSFDESLFEKELNKSKLHLAVEELSELKRWCSDRFGDRYDATIQKHLGNRA